MMHPIKKVKWICFDWDGTLIDSAARNINALKTAASIVCPNIESSIIEKACKSMQSPDWNIFFSKVPVEKNRIKVIKKEWRTLISSLPIADLFSDVRDVLSVLLTKYKIGVITSAERWRLDLEIQYHCLQNLISASVCSDEVKKQKPFPDPVLEFSRRYNGEIKLYIGDHIDDLKMAAAADVRACIIMRNSTTGISVFPPFLQIKQLSEIMNFV